jgi:hypothetical protein
MDIVCHKQLSFGSLLCKEVILDCEGGRTGSDAGGLPLRESDERSRLPVHPLPV